MKILKHKKAFTLIELLVVITIIGILATGGVAVYTTQIQKARDTTRIQDQEIIKSAAEQSYQDSATGEYPDESVFTGTVLPKYVQGKTPADPKTTQDCYGSGSTKPKCGYFYNTASSPLTNDSYVIEIAFENQGNRDNKAANTFDKGKDDNRYEAGTNMSGATLATSAIPTGFIEIK